MIPPGWSAEFCLWARRNGAAEGTLEGYVTFGKLFATFLAEQGLDHPATASRDTIGAFQSFLMTTFSRKGRPFSASTRHHIFSYLKKLYGYLIDGGHVLADPTRRLKMPRLPRRLPRAVLTSAEMRRLLDVPDTRRVWGLRDRAILEVLYGTGLRYSELVSLRLGDVQLDERILWVRQGKGQKDRVLPLGRWATHWLRRYLAASAELRGRQGTDRVFLTPRGNTLSNAVLNELLAAYARRTRIRKPVTAHIIRHTFATLLLRGGADVRKVQELLGHASLTSTQIYTHLNLEDLRRTHARCHPRERERSRRT